MCEGYDFRTVCPMRGMRLVQKYLMSHADGCIKPLIMHFIWSLVSSVSAVLLKFKSFSTH